MKQRVVSLSDRGRALEWLSIGFGVLLVADLVVALLLGEAKPSSARELAGLIEPARALVIAASAGHLIAIAALAVGLATLYRCGHRVWSVCALAALAVLLVAVVAVVSLPWFDLRDNTSDWNMIYGSGAGAEVCLVAFVLLGIRALAGDDEDTVPVFALGAAIGAAVLRWALVGTFPFDEETLQRSPMLPSNHAGLVAVASLASVGLVLLAIRATSRVVRMQIFAGEPGVTSPARAADWQRTARGLERFGALLIAKVALDAAAVPIFICAVLIGLDGFFTVQLVLVPLAGAVFSAGMVMALLAARTVPDPPDARAGFTGAALLIAACLAGDVYLATTRAWQPLLEALSALGHLVAYLAVLRSIGRIGERLGDEDVVRRARALGWLAALAVGAATIGGFVLRRSAADLALQIAVPIAVACVAFGVLVPCALLIREVAALVGRRFRPLPRAETRASLE